MEKTIVKSVLWKLDAIFIVLISVFAMIELLVHLGAYSNYRDIMSVAKDAANERYLILEEQYEKNYDRAYDSFVKGFNSITKSFNDSVMIYNQRINEYEEAKNAEDPSAMQKAILQQYTSAEAYACRTISKVVNTAEDFAAIRAGYDTAEDFYNDKTGGNATADAFAVNGVGYTKESYLNKVLGSKDSFVKKETKNIKFFDYYNYGVASAGIVAIGIVLFEWKSFKSNSIEVTDKRVIGKKGFWFFKKRIDIPMHRLTAVAYGGLGRVYVGSSAGKLRFKYISNNAEIHSAVCDLLIAQQAEKTGQ